MLKFEEYHPILLKLHVTEKLIDKAVTRDVFL